MYLMTLRKPFLLSNRRSLLTKTLLIMKLSAILLLITCLQAHARSYSQSISLSLKNAPLEQVFNEIQRQTGYSFVYNNGILQRARNIDIVVSGATVEDVLNLCIKGQPFSYFIVDKTIVIKPAGQAGAAATSPLAPPPGDIQGKVTDNKGTPLSGVTVMNKKTKKATKTDEQGNFTIRASASDVLVFSIVGYKNVEQKVTAAGTPVSLAMEIQITALDQMVVVGYGSVKRRDLTGSVSSVSTEEIQDVPFTSVDQALTGKAAGVQVVQSDGSPGGMARIRIRGGASLLGTNDPLYVIDGVPMTIQNQYVTNPSEIINPVENGGGADASNNSVSGSFERGLNSLGGLSINDIESIDILKDASATAIYGSKGANGVVIITTKRGKTNQKPLLEGNYYAGTTTALKEKVLNADQYKQLLTEAATNLQTEDAALGRPFNNPDGVKIINNDPSVFGPAHTDWLKLVLRNGTTQNANLDVRGGGPGSRYYTSLSYTKQNGVLIGTDFSRISGKINLDNDITPRLRVNTNLDYGFVTNHITNGIYGQALNANPTISPYNPDGTYTYMPQGQYGGANQNPLAVASGINQAKTVTLLGSLALEYDILKGLKFRSVGSVNYNNYGQLNYVPSYVDVAILATYGSTSASSNGGTGSQSSRSSTDAFFENTLTWNKDFSPKSRLNVLAGTSWEQYKSSYFSATGAGYPDNNLLNNLSAAAVPTAVAGSDPNSQNALLSFYLRANYTYKDRYLFTFTGRSDASSKFAPANQVGYFPSGAFAWRLSEESFLKEATWIDELKLRVSAGKTGTQNIGDYLYSTLYTPAAYGGTNALVPTQLGNAAAKWESTIQEDLGLDFSLFKSRLSGTIGLYQKTTDGALLNVNPAPSSSYSTVVLNVANIRNRGIELNLLGDVIRTKDFQWHANINISSNVSKVLNIEGGAFSDPNNRNALNLGNSVVEEGQPLGLLYGFYSGGVIKTQKQLDAYKAAFPFYVYLQPYLNIGDEEWVPDSTTIIKDGVIGKEYPKFYGGFTNTFTYKGFSLIALLTFQYGNQLLYLNDVASRHVEGFDNLSTRSLDHYSAANPNSNRPRMLFEGSNQAPDAASVFNASYIKLKSVTLSYDLSKAMTDKAKFRNVSVYVTATNLFKITHYPGLDPEVSDDPFSVIGGGVDASTYPTTKGVIAGIRFGF
jgi:TonB-dependent starch-binding outer membrane protein SusC